MRKKKKERTKTKKNARRSPVMRAIRMGGEEVRVGEDE